MLQYGMPKRKSIKSPRKPTDPNVIASSIVAQVTGESTKQAPVIDQNLVQKAIREGKDPLAVLLGQRGGLKGGIARAKKLNPERRKEIARQAAKARWARNKKK